jgi:hypothetical protein
MKLEYSSGKPIGYVNSLPSAIGFLQSKGWLSTKFRQTATSLLSPLKAMPVISHSHSYSWSIMNTTFAAQNYMLAATSYGLSTCTMEGFDERRLCSLLDIPTDLFVIPFVISTGYPLKPQVYIITTIFTIIIIITTIFTIITITIISIIITITTTITTTITITIITIITLIITITITIITLNSYSYHYSYHYYIII